MTPAEVLAGRQHVLLDFDGPVCAVFGGDITDQAVADELKQLVAGADLPPDVAAAHDPFDVLRFAGKVSAAAAEALESRFRDLEVQAVATAPETPGARTAIEALIASGRTVTIVSNNSAAAVRHYLDIHGLSELISQISARESADTQLLKPDPFLIRRVNDGLGARPSACVMIGDSETDIDAARAAGTAVIGYANKPGKCVRLQRRGADAVIDQLSELLPAHPAPR